jgi:hypothetical protein
LRSDKSTEFKPLPKRWVVERFLLGWKTFDDSPKNMNELSNHPKP